MRLVLITRRFWPLVGGAEVAMGNLAAHLQQEGHQVTLLTARWDPSWPPEVQYAGVRVLRLPQPRQRIWGTLRYMQALRRWIRQHCDGIDLIYVSMLKHDAYAAVSAGQRGQLPVILRAEGAGETGDVAWQEGYPFGATIRRMCCQADALVAPSSAIFDELTAAGYPAAKITRISNGVKMPAQVSPGRRRDARLAITQAVTNLSLPHDAHLSVFTGRLHPSKGLKYLLDAWPSVLVDHPEAHLWLVGVGPDEKALRSQIRRLRLPERVRIIGPFDNVDDVLSAADLYILPSLQEGMSLALLEAMASGLPVVATDIPGNREVVAPGETGLLVPPQDSGEMSAAVCRLIDHGDFAAKLGKAARRHVEAHFALRQTAESHVHLFHRLLDSHTLQSAP